ncbi:MAG TPA: precorrin-6y C5,15-methyltransferase (decarboxylating) subunit CbiE [Chloroflexota bacterium]|nr:precorrin-6y C5,15-methyltransferase (decarboxylating) subunit CbiE [Chloroflexota bacterium]
MKRITVVGLDRHPLSAAALSAIREADVLAGGRRQLDQFAEHPAERVLIGANVGETVSGLGNAQERGRGVVVLASGDPLLFGIGATLVRELGAERVDVLPAVSSIQEAFAQVGVAWHDAVILSAHGRPLEGVIAAALGASKVAILTDSVNTPAAVAQALLDAGMEGCRAVVCEQFGQEGERVTDSTLAQLVGCAFDPLNVLLIIRQPQVVRLEFGRSDAEFDVHNGQITKPEVRAVILSKLRLPTYGVVWDVGAGAGSVAIEAARLMPHGHVFAIERDSNQLRCLRINRAKCGAGNLQVVEGEAPEALAGLPEPQAVFIGGSGGRLPELLTRVPRPFVASFAVLEHVGAVLARFPDAEVVEMNVARSVSIADGHRLAAQNPVYIVSVAA